MPDGSEDPGAWRRTDWTSIPSGVPSPARALLIQVNGAYNDGSTTLTNSLSRLASERKHLCPTPVRGIHRPRCVKVVVRELIYTAVV